MEFARKLTPRLICSSIWMGIREDAAPFHAKISTIKYCTLRVPKDPITRSKPMGIGVGKKPDLSNSRHTHSFPLGNTVPLPTEKYGTRRVLFNCAVETDVPDKIQYGRIFNFGKLRTAWLENYRT